MRLVTAREMQEIDRRTIDGGLVPSLTLMENAGRAAAREAARLLSGYAEPRVEILCGKGNNGGDGLVVARLLAETGVRVRVHLTHPAIELSADARTNHDRLRGTRVEVRLLPQEIAAPGPIADPRCRPRPDPARLDAEPGGGEDLPACLSRAALCVDALLGTGVTSDVRGRLAALIDLLGHHGRQTLAIDVPSGVDADGGEVRGTAVWADVTVTFGLPKLGLVVFPGRERVGRLIVADIGFPDRVLASVAGKRWWVDADAARALVPRLDPTAHKYQRGCVVVVAGSRAFTGAAALVAEAVLRSGAGIVHLVVPASLRPLMQTKLTEVIVHGVPETEAGTCAPQASQTLKPLLERADAVAIGSGLGDSETTRGWVQQLLRQLELPAVVDADGLPSMPSPPHPGKRIVTPHAGELARWIGRSSSDVSATRLETALETALARQVVVVAKGAPTFIATPDGDLHVNGSGHAGLATAGSGDVLTGIVAGLLAQGLDADAAAVLGVYMHGLAADVFAQHASPRALCAGDLLTQLPFAYRQLGAD